MTTAEPTRGQLERSLAQQFQNLYREQIGQRPSKVICQFFDEKLTVVLYNTVSPAEKALLAVGKEEFAKKLRSNLHEAIAPLLRGIIENIVGISVISLLIDSDLVNGYSGFTAILTETPSVRDPQSIPKGERRQKTDSGNG
jgi:uncharacterized protein YbcI